MNKLVLIFLGQKRRRDDYLSFARCLVDAEGNEEKMEPDANGQEKKKKRKKKAEARGKEEGEEEDVFMDENAAIASAASAAARRLCRRYDHQLMLSEWLVEIPTDFPDKWKVSAVPEGKRSLVVAGNGQTRQYARGGRLLYGPFSSLLPGGSRCQGPVGSDVTILDCIYEYTKEIFYVLDVMIWRDKSFYELSSDERFSFIDNKIGTNGLVTKTSYYNPFPFVRVPRFDASKDAVVSFFSTSLECFPVPIDGLLCFHRDAQYLPGKIIDDSIQTLYIERRSSLLMLK